ncbi:MULTISPECIES: polysaccharide biosynthesis protein [Bacillaceae]|uniref:Polysaccharide biosynthesis protein n=1 Tax=Evansella alkalicola TaxID=745819 RepID=A0ABS6JXZ7_9BACI|nr:polysaccharide biosynthesis protein [Litchfieldia alkalitelluris]MBU9723455.1 polysaccharide biosynthesis protein [Bacillus alkalicola]
MTINDKELESYYKNKNILVTGGSGSIGEYIVAELLKFKPKLILVLNKDDSKQYLMKQKYGNMKNIQFYLADIRNYQDVEYATRDMDYVFHAAALKQVPICEDHPIEAVKTNIIGSENVIKASISNKVKKVVNISTDKAVNPVNTLGMTKRIAENMFYRANSMFNNKHTKFCSVRFGNVIGSRGSVISLFRSQIQAKEPLSLTDPAMTRFFMTIPQAVHLILNAMYYCKGGETFILKMKALKIGDLVKAFKKYCEETGMNIPSVQTIGMRPGEKMHEELLYDNEQNVVLEGEDFFIVIPTQESKITPTSVQPK